MTAPFHFDQGHALRNDEVVGGDAPRELPRIDDYFKWGHEQAALLRAGRFDAVDLANIIDEIEAVARSELHVMDAPYTLDRD